MKQRSQTLRISGVFIVLRKLIGLSLPFLYRAFVRLAWTGNDELQAEHMPPRSLAGRAQLRHGLLCRAVGRAYGMCNIMYDGCAVSERGLQRYRMTNMGAEIELSA